jgi:hypothetical protein
MVLQDFAMLDFPKTYLKDRGEKGLESKPEMPRSTKKNCHASAKSHLLISVTFATPTPDFSN